MPSAWEIAYKKAMRDYGSRAQAERIAWGAIDQASQAQLLAREQAEERRTRRQRTARTRRPARAGKKSAA
jgi:hypothetical protein